MKKIAVLISGSGTNLQAIIDKCLSGYIEAEIVCVLSNDPNAYGLERAKLNNIKTKYVVTIGDDDFFILLQRKRK